MSKLKEKTGSGRRKDQLSEPASGLVKEPKQVIDQRSTSVFMGMPAAHAPALPLFMDTLYKARDFDPL